MADRLGEFTKAAGLALALTAAPACNFGIQVGEVTTGGGLVGGTAGSPTVNLGGQSGASSAVATYPNPCEIDVDFGNVPVGLMDSVTIQIQNHGNTALDLAQANPALDPEFSLDYGTQQPVQPGDFAEFSVAFAPYKVGEVTSAFTIQTNGVNAQCRGPAGSSPGSIVTVMLVGSGIELSLVVQPGVLDFGNTLINTTAQKSVSLINKSTVPLAGITAAVNGTDAKLFTVLNCPSTLAAGASAMVNIAYAPLALEVRSLADVTFSGPGGETATLLLFGEPVGVALNVEPNPCNFGFAALDTNVVCCITLTNWADVPVLISGVSGFEDDGAFAVANRDDATPPNAQTFPGSPIDIQGGASAKVCFSFSPSVSQQYSGQLNLDTNDPSGTNPLIQLTGWGGGPQIFCSPTSLFFDGGSGSSLPVTCTNTGTAITGTSLLLQPPTASPSNFTAQFDAATNIYPAGGLAPGESAQIDVTYATATSSGVTGTLSIQNNGGQGKTLEIPLTGQGRD